MGVDFDPAGENAAIYQRAGQKSLFLCDVGLRNWVITLVFRGFSLALHRQRGSAKPILPSVSDWKIAFERNLFAIRVTEASHEPAKQ